MFIFVVENEIMFVNEELHEYVNARKRSHSCATN
jgi:hypothetical protein